MRLINMQIDGYRVLRSLEIEFRRNQEKPEENYALTFLVGVNGSGKSTVFKALVEILFKLLKEQTITFPFKLEYLLGDDTERHVVVDQYAQDLEITIGEQEKRPSF